MSTKGSLFQKFEDSEICVLGAPAINGPIRCFVFESDGVISTLREGWQKIMAMMMIEMIVGQATPSDEELNIVKSEVYGFVRCSAGFHVLLQMGELVDMISSYGFVPDNEIHEPAAYKAIYDKRLKVSVNERLATIGSQATVEDFMIRGVRGFLRELFNQRVEMVVSSGTDEIDLMFELDALNATKFFSEIHGARATYQESNKRMVLANLIDATGFKGQEIAVVGNGRIDMEVAKAFGCIAIGVASDEIKRHGWNMPKALNLARARVKPDILIMDFHQARQLLNFLNLPV